MKNTLFILKLVGERGYLSETQEKLIMNSQTSQSDARVQNLFQYKVRLF